MISKTKTKKIIPNKISILKDIFEIISLNRIK